MLRNSPAASVLLGILLALPEKLMKSMLTMGFALAIGLAATAPDLAPVEVVVSASAQSATAGIQEAIDKLG